MTPIPELIRGFVSQHGSHGEVHQVCRSDTKLIPEGGGGIACKAHRPSLLKNCPVDVFGTTILHRCIGGSDKVIDSIGKAPGGHQFGNDLSIISHKYLKGPVKLHHYMFVPVLQYQSCFTLLPQWKGPNIAREVINYIHQVQTSRMGRTRHWTTQVVLSRLGSGAAHEPSQAAF